MDGSDMQGENKERWKTLCEKIAVEKEPGKFLALVAEINRVLDEEQDRLMELSESRSNI
jgi:hypothetical protein